MKTHLPWLPEEDRALNAVVSHYYSEWSLSPAKYVFSQGVMRKFEFMKKCSKSSGIWTHHTPQEAAFRFFWNTEARLASTDLQRFRGDIIKWSGQGMTEKEIALKLQALSENKDRFVFPVQIRVFLTLEGAEDGKPFSPFLDPSRVGNSVDDRAIMDHIASVQKLFEKV